MATKKRRLSKNLYLLWDKTLIVKDELKKLRKHRLGISQVQWNHLQNQLYVIGCVTNKDDKYLYPMVTSNDFRTQIPDSTYVQLMKHLEILDLFKLCIWRYANFQFATPPKKLQDFFNHTNTTTNDMVKISIQKDLKHDSIIDTNRNMMDELYVKVEKEIVQDLNSRLIQKKTKLKINDEYTLQNVMWTVHQREVAKNTRNHFLYNFQMQYPMISDIKLTESNRQFVYQFLTALLKANVSASIISNICFSFFGYSNLDFELKEKILLKDVSLKKEKTDVQMQQRTSITDFTYMEKENKAACIIQRAVRRILQRKKNAVATIEKWWLPYAIKGKVEREVFERRLSASVDILEEKIDKFKYEDFKKEIIQDLKEINNTKRKGYIYWLQIYCLVGLGCIIEYALTLSGVFDEKIMILFPWILLQLLTVKRLIKKVIFIQTILLIAMTCRFFNTAMRTDTVVVRFLIYFILVNACREYYLYGFILALAIRFALSFTNFEQLSLYKNEGFVFVYDIYSAVTIVACHRTGDPIQMLHKWMVGVVVFTIILAGIAATNILFFFTSEL